MGKPSDIIIEEVKEFSPHVRDEVVRLLSQIAVDAQELTDDHFKYLLSDPHTHLYIAKKQDNGGNCSHGYTYSL